MTKVGHKKVSTFWLAASAAIFVLAGTVGFAPASAAVSAEAQQACTPDVFRLCNEFVPDVPKITACMARKRASLSPACRAATTPPRAARKTSHHHHSDH
jgi:hypothetical protein